MPAAFPSSVVAYGPTFPDAADRHSTTLTALTASSSSTFPVTELTRFRSYGGIFWVDLNMYSYTGKSASMGAGNLTGCTLVYGGSTNHLLGATVEERPSALHVNSQGDEIIAIENYLLTGAVGGWSRDAVNGTLTPATATDKVRLGTTVADPTDRLSVSTNLGIFAAAADANPTLRLSSTNGLEWGAGGASSLDVKLSRAAADRIELAANDILRMMDGTQLQFGATGQITEKFVTNASGGYFVRSDGAFVIPSGLSDYAAAASAAFTDGASSGVHIVLPSGNLPWLSNKTFSGKPIQLSGNESVIKIANIGSAVFALLITGATGVRVTGITFDGQRGSGNSACGLRITTSSYVVVRDNQFINCHDQALGMSGNGGAVGFQANSCLDLLLCNNTANLNDTGLDVQNSHAVIADNTCFDNERLGINVFGSGSTVSGRTVETLVESNVCQLNGQDISIPGHGIRINESSRVTVHNNICNENYQYGILLYDGVTNAQVTNNFCLSNQRNGILIEGNSDDPSGEIVRYVTIQGNRANSNTSYGIRLFDAFDCSIIGNEANYNQDGIAVHVGSDRNLIVSNVMEGNVGNAYDATGGGANNFTLANIGDYMTVNVAQTHTALQTFSAGISGTTASLSSTLTFTDAILSRSSANTLLVQNRLEIKNASTGANPLLSSSSSAQTLDLTGRFRANPGSSPDDAILLNIAALTSAGTRNSHNLLVIGQSFDASAQQVDWIQNVNVTSNAGASVYRFRNRIGAGTMTTRAQISDAGSVQTPSDFSAFASLTEASPVARLSTTGLFFGAGGGTALDVQLSRGTADRLELASGDTLRIATDGSTGSLQFGANGDVSIFRGALDRLDVATGDSVNFVSGSLLFGGTTVIDSARAGTFTTVNGVTVTTSTGTFTLTNGKTFAVQNSLTLAGTDGTTLTFQGTDTYVGRATTDTLTNKTLTSPTINSATINTSTIATPTITGGTHTAITSLGIRSTGTGAFDLTIANTENLTAGRTLTVTLNDAARTLNLGGNLTTTGGAITLTATGATNVTLPTTGTLATLAGSETFTNKVLTTPTLTTPNITGKGILTPAPTPTGSASAITLGFDAPAATSAFASVNQTGDTFLNRWGQTTLTNPTPTGTITNAATLVVDGAPIASTNVVITNAYSQWNKAGSARFDGGLQVSQPGTFAVNTSGNITKINNVTTSWPAVQGGASTFLQNDGSGNLSWVAATVSSLAWSSLTDPSGNLSLAMAGNTTTFTSGATTGASNLWTFTDTASNTGTGFLVSVATATGSTAKPFRVRAVATDAISVNASGITTLGPATGTNDAGDANAVNVYGANSTLAAADGNVQVNSTDGFAIDKGGSVAFGGFYNGTNTHTFASISGRKENSTSGNFAGYLELATRVNGGAMTSALKINSSQQVIINDGSAGTPSFVFTGATTTGLFRPSGASIGFSIAGAEAARLTSDSNFGVGASPSSNEGLILQKTVTASGASAFGMRSRPTLTAAANSDNLHAFSVNNISAAKGVFTGLTVYGVSVDGSTWGTSGAGTISTAYGVYAVAPTVATTNYAIYASGDAFLGGANTTGATSGFPIIPVIAGAPTGAAPNGSIAIDSTNGRLYFRYSSTWHYVAQTA